MMPETCWDSVDNKHLIVASCWFSLSLHNLLTVHGHRNLKHFLYSITFFFLKSCLYEMMWKKQSRLQMTAWCTHIASWIPKATNTLSEYVILIAVTLKQWLHERASVLRYTHLACLLYEVKVFLLRATCWWSWVWRNGGMILAGKHRSTRRTPCCCATVSEIDFVRLYHSCTCWEQ